MTKEFYTEKDIEDLFKSGVMSLEVGENTVLTELAYEKAGRLGMQLIQDRPDNPPCAPVRPYLSQQRDLRSISGVADRPEPVPHSPDGQIGENNLHRRIREAVTARLGTRVDSALLETIIQRVLKSTGVK